MGQHIPPCRNSARPLRRLHIPLPLNTYACPSPDFLTKPTHMPPGALKSLGVVPRTPSLSPSPELDTRDPDTMTRDELIAALARTQVRFPLHKVWFECHLDRQRRSTHRGMSALRGNGRRRVRRLLGLTTMSRCGRARGRRRGGSLWCLMSRRWGMDEWGCVGVWV